jgi:NADP-dependent 3-hydroxy acid dehydrogenase YdfG
VNNGRHLGLGISERILETPIDEYGKFLMAHAIAPTLIVQKTLPGMSERGSGIYITISSAAATDLNPRHPPGQGGSGLAYRMGKVAGHSIVGSLVSEYHDVGVRAYNIDPGAVLTERTGDRLAALGYDTSRAVHPPDIAKVVVWLVTSPADEVETRYQYATVSAWELIREMTGATGTPDSNKETSDAHA